MLVFLSGKELRKQFKSGEDIPELNTSLNSTDSEKSEDVKTD